MDLKQRLLGLENAQATEVMHLLFRYLTHRLDEPSFRKLFAAEAPSPTSERSYEIAVATVHDIEEKEGTKVTSFTPSTLGSYVDYLVKLSKELQPAHVDPRLLEKAERELQLLRSM